LAELQGAWGLYRAECSRLERLVAHSDFFREEKIIEEVATRVVKQIADENDDSQDHKKSIAKKIEDRLKEKRNSYNDTQEAAL
jgi:hypothetical protein